MIMILRVTAHVSWLLIAVVWKVDCWCLFRKLLPLVLLFLMYKWMGSTLSSYAIQPDGTIVEHLLAGFSWTKGDSQVFNWHPLMMTTGFIFCSSQAALVYITSPYSHEINKRIHLSLHLIAFICTIIGLVAVFRFHFEHNITNFYSLHSWLGISVASIFALHVCIRFSRLYFWHTQSLYMCVVHVELYCVLLSRKQSIRSIRNVAISHWNWLGLIGDCVSHCW